MRFDLARSVRLIMALCVMLSFAFSPLLSKQAMAFHHTIDAKITAATGHGHAAAVSGSCEEKSGSQSNKKNADCCDMACAPFEVVESGSAFAFVSHFVVYSVVEADQLTSRINFGLKRPPRT